jgi:hypothetical protein
MFFLTIFNQDFSCKNDVIIAQVTEQHIKKVVFDLPFLCF